MPGMAQLSRAGCPARFSNVHVHPRPAVLSARRPASIASFRRKVVASSTQDGAQTVSSSSNGVASTDLASTIGEAVASSAGPLATNDEDWSQAALSIVVVGASGDLARKKIYPALFALFFDGMLPETVTIYGFARSKMTDAEFREYIQGNLTCRLSNAGDCSAKLEDFVSRLFYHAGQYSSADDFGALAGRMAEQEGGHLAANRIFYFSIPPSIFTAVASAASSAASSERGWTRMIVEKPFGRDLESFRQLEEDLGRSLTEDQMYRIDHYLGKELIENLTVLRFANLVFEPLWNRQHIRNVQVIFSENFGTEGRGGYFDQYGIVRDVIQNHLLQIVALFAMEPPVSLDAEDIRNEKVKVLRSMRQVQLSDVVLGQYRGRRTSTAKLPGYLDDFTVPPDSLTPTFAAVAIFINNPRWDGVPFLLKAGKALAARMAEIRVQFRHPPGNLYARKLGPNLDQASNELVIRIQPDEAIYLKINNKVPGLGVRLETTRLDLTYGSRYKGALLPDAYERLILDVVNGDKRLFIRNDELEVAWKLFTPVLKEIESKGVVPEAYPYGSRGPIGSHYLAAKYGVRWGDIASAEETDSL